MQFHRSTLVVAVAAVSGLAFANPPARCGTESSTQAQAAALPQLVQNLAGEFEGQVQVRGQDGRKYGALISASGKLEDNGQTLVTCFQGNVNGQPMTGAAMWKLPAQGQSLQHAMFNSVSSASLRCSSACSPQSGTLTLTGQATTTMPKVEQVIKTQSENEIVCEWYTTDQAGKRQLVMQLELTRLPQGENSAALALHGDTNLLGKVRSSISQTASAER